MLLDDYTNLGENPPRPFNISTFIRYLFQGCSVQGAFLILIFASILFWIFGIKSEIVNFSFSQKNWIETTGILKEIIDTKAEVNDYNIYQYNFSYEINGSVFENASYSTYLEKWNKGQNIAIRYNVDSPREANILNMQSKIFPFSVGLIFVLLPTFLGLFLLIRGLWQNLKLILLLKYGVFTKAKVSIKDMSKSNFERYYYNFEINGVKYKSNFFCKKNEEGDVKKVLYLPSSPKNHLPVLDLVNTKKMDKFGKIIEPNYSIFTVFFLPFIIVIVNLIGWFLH